MEAIRRTGFRDTVQFRVMPVLLALLLNGIMIGFVPGLVDPITERPPSFDSVSGFKMIRIQPPQPTMEPKSQRRVKPVKADPIQPLRRQMPPVTPVRPRLALALNSRLQAPELDPELPSMVQLSIPELPTVEISKAVDPKAEEPKAVEPQKNGIYRLTDLDAPLVPVVRTPPLYPRSAKRQNIQGWVEIEFLLTPKGDVESLQIVDSEPKGVFEDSVIRAVGGWRFNPGTVNGKPVKIRVTQKLQFRLDHDNH